jgi:hypothetical protein
MTDAWSRFWLALSVMVSTGAFAVAVMSGRGIDGAGWAQFFGSIIALGVAFEFGRREARDRRAEAINLRLIRQQELADRAAAAEALQQKWLNVPVYCIAKIDLAISAIEEHRSVLSSVTLSQVAERAKDLAAAAAALDYMMKFEPPSMEIVAVLVETQVNLREAAEAFDTFVNKTDKQLSKFGARAYADALTVRRNRIIRWRDTVQGLTPELEHA